LKVKIVTDSSADLLELPGVPFESVPLKIITAEKEYIDDPSLNVERMVEDLSVYHGRSSTSCPNQKEWITAFGDAQQVFCVTITSALSGSYNAACAAKEEYEEQHPDRRVCVIDSLSAGPELVLITEKLKALIVEGKSFEAICSAIRQYQKKTKLLFMLESMQNLANNGRVSNLTAKFAGILNIRIVGKASDIGTLEPMDKPRGVKKTLAAITQRLMDMGYFGGKVQIAHCFNSDFAEEIKHFILQHFPNAVVSIHKTLGLCSYYAEKGGVLVGFETE